MGLTLAPGLPPLILSLRMLSTRNLGVCYTVLLGFHHWFSLGLWGVGFAGVKGASTRAKGASKVGFQAYLLLLGAEGVFHSFCCYLSCMRWR
jgi:hypothetical protein